MAKKSYKPSKAKWYCYKCNSYHVAGSEIVKKHRKDLGGRKVGS